LLLGILRRQALFEKAVIERRALAAEENAYRRRAARLAAQAQRVFQDRVYSRFIGRGALQDAVLET